MHNAPPSSPSVVVGVDGSRAGTTAALWAVDEAVERDVPLRLVYALEPSAEGEHPDVAARRLATAEMAIRYAHTAVASANALVKTEMVILRGRPATTLLEASRSAAMLCVGAVGFKHRAVGRLGSTAATLASSAHCPVAIIRGTEPVTSTPRAILVEVDGEASYPSVLKHGVTEARLRSAPLRVLTTWQSHFSDVHDTGAVLEGNRHVKAQLDRRLARWVRENIDVDVTSVVDHCSTLEYLANNAKDIQLLVAASNRAGGLSEVVASTVEFALRDAHCSVLICQSPNAL